jgi:AcrR family transcriptional regulator
MRDPAIEAARGRVLKAARELLMEMQELADFPMDRVAAKAGVARTIVHQQFRSPAGLLEALYDDLMTRSKLSELPDAFKLAAPGAMLDAFVAAFAALWDTERIPVRRLRASASFDRFLFHALRAREQYRRETVAVLTRRLAEHGLPEVTSEDERLDILCALTSFEFFDALAGPDHAIAAVVPTVQRMVREALGVERAEPLRHD